MSTMKQAYDLKEDLFDMYKCKDKTEAQKHYRKRKTKAEKVRPFKALVNTIDNCYDEVFNYFDGYVTNAIAEGTVSQIRAISTMGRGYGFEILRAKALFFLNHKIEIPRFGEGTLSNMLSRRPSAFAVRKNDVSEVKRLIAGGSDVQKYQDGSTPLHLAARGGFTESSQALLDHNAYVDAIDQKERTPFT